MASNLIPTPAAARRIGAKPQTLVKWRHLGIGPRFVRMGRLVRYRVEDLDAYVADSTHATATSAARVLLGEGWSW